MPFSEEIIAIVRRKSHYSCCLCKTLYVEIHHIIPEKESGTDTEENAAPLCPSCHEIFGVDPSKRKFITEARDTWYEICKKRFVSDQTQISELKDLLGEVVTKKDLEKALDQIIKRLKSESNLAHEETHSTQIPPQNVPSGIQYIHSERYSIERIIRGMVLKAIGGWAGCSIAPFENYLEIASNSQYFPEKLLNEIREFFGITDMILSLGDLPESRYEEIKYLSMNIHNQLNRLDESLPNINEPH